MKTSRAILLASCTAVAGCNLMPTETECRPHQPTGIQIRPIDSEAFHVPQDDMVEILQYITALEDCLG